MDAAIDFLAITMLAVMPVNVVDWMFVRRGPLMWVPRSRGQYVWFAYYALLTAAAVCLLYRWIPSTVMGWIVFPPFILEQLISIWMRHAGRATHAS